MYHTKTSRSSKIFCIRSGHAYSSDAAFAVRKPTYVDDRIRIFHLTTSIFSSTARLWDLRHWYAGNIRTRGRSTQQSLFLQPKKLDWLSRLVEWGTSWRQLRQWQIGISQLERTLTVGVNLSDETVYATRPTNMKLLKILPANWFEARSWSWRLLKAPSWKIAHAVTFLQLKDQGIQLCMDDFGTWLFIQQAICAVSQWIFWRSIARLLAISELRAKFRCPETIVTPSS